MNERTNAKNTTAGATPAEPGRLLQSADQVMYRAKTAGKNRVEFAFLDDRRDTTTGHPPERWARAPSPA